jgi:hypothetical protein
MERINEWRRGGDLRDLRLICVPLLFLKYLERISYQRRIAKKMEGPSGYEAGKFASVLNL